MYQDVKLINGVLHYEDRDGKYYPFKFIGPGGGRSRSGGAGNAISVSDEGIQLTANVSSFDFVGDGVSASNVGNAVTITIPGPSDIISQFTHVDGFSGNDSTAQVRNFSKKFKTLDAAITAVGNNSRIFVWNGSYVVGDTINLYKRNITWYFAPQVSISRFSGSNPLFDASSETVASTLNIFGNASFLDTSDGGFIKTNVNITEINLYCKNVNWNNPNFLNINCIELVDSQVINIKIESTITHATDYGLLIENTVSLSSDTQYDININRILCSTPQGTVLSSGVRLLNLASTQSNNININAINSSGQNPGFSNFEIIENMSNSSGSILNIRVGTSTTTTNTDGWGLYVETMSDVIINYSGDISYGGPNNTPGGITPSALFYYNKSDSNASTLYYNGNLQGNVGSAIITPVVTGGEIGGNLYVEGNSSGANDVEYFTTATTNTGKVITINHNDYVNINGIVTSNGAINLNLTAIAMNGSGIRLVQQGAIFNNFTTGFGLWISDPAGTFIPSTLKIVTLDAASIVAVAAATNIYVTGIVGTTIAPVNVVNAIVGSILYTNANVQ